MASKNKLEEYIRDRFDEREIVPSNRAWDQLSAELELQGKSKRSFFWVSVAAVLIGLLVGSTVYFNALKSPGIPETNVVETPVSDLRSESDVVTLDSTTTKTGSGLEALDSAIAKTGFGVEVLDNTIEKTNLEAVTFENETEILEKERTIVVSQEAINSKIEEVIAQVALLEQTDADITDAEVDSLLLQAQRELFSNNIIRDDRTIDAMALLADVEGELDRPFREQLFDMLKEGYFKARNAVAARNN